VKTKKERKKEMEERVIKKLSTFKDTTIIPTTNNFSNFKIN
jgi:hypothetical protein